MYSLTPAQRHCIPELLDKGLSGHVIANTIGIGVGYICNFHSKHCSSFTKALGSHPQKLSPADTQYAVCLITFYKAENANDVAKTLQDMSNTSFSIKIVRRAVGSTGKKAVTKQKWPFLSKKQSSQRMDFAEAHKDWTVGDWKGLFGQMKPKSIILGVMGKIWVWKMPGEGLNTKLVCGQSSLEEVF